jgi:hypothetical protein
MLNRQDVLADRRFWAVIYAEMLGQVGEPADPGAVYSLLSVTEKDAQDWFNDVMGWASGGGDGDATPATIRVPLARDLELAIEFELGDVSWHVRDPDCGDARLASIGGHWELPGLRWDEAVCMASASPGPDWMITLLLLPVIWLTDREDGQAVRSSVVSAWISSELVPAASAPVLADAWLKAVEGGRAYHWRQCARGWVCDAHWSTRGEQRDSTDIEQINRLVEAAAGGAA